MLNWLRRWLCPDYARRDSNWQQDKQAEMHHAYTHGFHESIEHAYKTGDQLAPKGRIMNHYIFSIPAHLFAASTMLTGIPMVSISVGAILLTQATPPTPTTGGTVFLSQNQLFIIAVFQSFVPGIAAIIAAVISGYLVRKTATLHSQINSRMDEIVMLVEKKADAEGYNRGQAEAQAEAKAVLASAQVAAALVRAEGKEDRAEMRGELAPSTPPESIVPVETRTKAAKKEKP